MYITENGLYLHLSRFSRVSENLNFDHFSYVERRMRKELLFIDSIMLVNE